MPYLPELLGPTSASTTTTASSCAAAMRAGGLHGGSHLRHSWSDHWYRYQDGLIRNGLTVITSS